MNENRGPAVDRSTPLVKKGSVSRRFGVFHPGTQHSWQTARALQDLGRLEWYATSIFYQPDRWPFRLADYMPRSVAERMRTEFKRFYHPALEPRHLRTFGAHEWMERLAARLRMRRTAAHFNERGNITFSAGVTRLLRQAGDIGIWGYNGSSWEVFEQATVLGAPRILDRTIGDRRFFKKIMDEIYDEYNEFFIDGPLRVKPEMIDREEAEYELADRILVGCEFARDTILPFLGDGGAKISVLPYCFDDTFFTHLPQRQPLPRDRPVRFLFIGQCHVRKGVHLLLKVFSQIPESVASLTIVGDLQLPTATFQKFADRLTYIPTVPRNQVPEQMARHDCLIFPSYFEGFPISLLEAQASGLGIIQSRNCGIVASEQSGIVLESLTEEALHEAVMKVVSDRAMLESWHVEAVKESRRFTYERYRKGVEDVINALA